MRHRTLQVVLIVVGILFVGLLWPLATSLAAREPGMAGDQMMLSLYVVLGVFLLRAAHAPAANASLVWFAGWANLAHAATMAVQTTRYGPDEHLTTGVIIFGIIGVIFLALAPRKQEQSRAAVS